VTPESISDSKADMNKQATKRKESARYDHLDKSRYGADILGLKPARLLRSSPKPEPSMQQRGFGKSPRR
jgi:hypothetical protein